MSKIESGKITVFIADDHAVLREGLRLLMESKENIEVMGDAENGREAVRKIKTLKPHVVIMDIAMPELDGIEATRQICEASPSTRVIILSMHSSPEYVHRSIEAGATGYILKESAAAEIINAVITVNSGKRYLSKKISEQVIDEYFKQRKTGEKESILNQLSPREMEILKLVVEGKSSSEIANIIFISPKTVETYRSRIMQKLGISDITGLVKFAIRHGITSLE
ncbi:MAG TPA: response regulator transcription factor [Syntrophorhabdaceae bacterium]|nr:response regulator transcription factor [Syntrophorhabdaceae bacterium]